MKHVALPLLTCVIIALGFVTDADAATITPSRFDDPPGIGNCPADCSLRQAIVFAQSGDKIQLGAGTYTLSQGTALTVPATVLSIAGISSRSTTINANQTSGVIDNSGLLSITDLTVTGGRGLLFGGISNLSTLGLLRVTVTANVAIGNGSIAGGGIGNAGTLVLNRSNVLHNEAHSLDGSDAYGAGMMVYSTAQTTIVNSTFFDNFTSTSSSQGGGGALYVAGSASADVYNSTFVGNTSTPSQAGGQLRADAGSVMILRNNIISGGSGQLGWQNCFNLGTVTSAGGNVESTTPSQCGLATITGDLIGVDPLVGPFGDHGGPTDTFVLSPGSPAIGAGVLATCQNTAAAVADTDQRGGRRIVGGKCNPGATQSNSLANVSLAGTIAAPGFGKPVTYNVTVTNDGPDAIFGGTLHGAACSFGPLAVGARTNCSGTATWDGASPISLAFSVGGDYNDPDVGSDRLSLTAPAPRFTKVSLKPSKVKPAKKGGVIATGSAKGGSTLTYVSVDAAKLGAQVQKPVAGFVKNGKCKKISRTVTAGKKCKLWSNVGKAGALSVKQQSGRLKLTGRASNRALKRGKYRVGLTAYAANAANGSPRYINFSVK